MGFYYFGAIGTLVALVSGVLLAGIFWLGWAFLARRKITGPVALVSLPVAMVLPWSEELWIAWHFGQACEEAGTFIYKTVTVDGFYDDTCTTHAGPPTPQAVEAFDKAGYRIYGSRVANT